MSSDIAIKVEHLSKCYTIYDRPGDRLKQFLLPRLRQVVGMEQRPYFREFWALKDVSLEIRKGQTVGLIGRNGSGKSTLLQMICGTLNPTHGRVETHGRIAALLELGSGFNPEFTGRENVYLNAAILGLTREETEDRFDDIAAFADIGQFLDQPVKSYSSGMVVRLAFAVQAMVDPQILVVDEALAVGDERFQRKCFARLEELKSKGTSILFVSHSAPSVIELCDHAHLLNDGMQVLSGKPKDVVRAYQRLLYADKAELDRIVQEYSAPKAALAEEQSEADEAGKPEAGSGASFDPGLVPETTTVYPAQGAEILSISILDEAGQHVNVLQPQRVYAFEIKGRFEQDFVGVYFGVHLKTVSGVELTGQRYPEDGAYVKDVKAGSDFSIRFSFRMSLTAGIYFAGCGVWSMGEPNCAHRIVDAIMFRVMPADKLVSFGYVDLRAADVALELK
jgi:lipopolysaccharide transport system ATP-binding protein